MCMEFLSKIENAINYLLIKLGELFIKLIQKITPLKVKLFFKKIRDFITFLILNFKRLPDISKAFAISFITKVKSELLSFDYKGKFNETYNIALQEYKKRVPQGGGKIKEFFLMPFLIMAEWLRGLTVAQSLLLLTLTSGSILSVISIVSTGERMIEKHFASRAPASEEEIKYARPDYYKQETRHYTLTNLRLPVYVANVNELRSVDIDFTATVSNRQVRMFLEKWEFQLRDHLILHVEPSVASFPLEEEGKAIIRRKILIEVNAFILEHKVEGEVEDLKLTYILAN